MFHGFERRKVDVGADTINCVFGGRGDPVLLLHGYPQTLAEWALLAPLLAAEHTVVCADLRGYGGSSKPAASCTFSDIETTFRTSPWSRRAIAKWKLLEPISMAAIISSSPIGGFVR